MADITQVQGEVNYQSLRSFGEGKFINWKLSKRGEPCIIDFYTEMVLEGRGYQIKAGTITTPIAADVAITDTAAEMSLDAGQGLVVIPVYCNISVRSGGTSTANEYAIKTVDTASSAGAVFVPLLLLGETDGLAARATGRAATAGGVTVTAELATTTRRLWSYSNPVAIGAGHELTTLEYEPRTPHLIANNACCYVQIASAVTTVPSYYASLDFIEFLFTNL